jgi:hypothetical protein
MTLAVLALLACGGERAGDAGAAGSADPSEIATPEGIRLRFPPGFTPRVENGKDGTAYVAVRENEVVAATVGEADVDCEAVARQAEGIERFETAGGFDACSLPAADADGRSLAIVLVELEGLAVTAAAVAAPGRAAELARAFADAVRLDGRLKPLPGKAGLRLGDPRGETALLVGRPWVRAGGE